MMTYKEAIRKIEEHQRVHHMQEQPRCQKITEALSLAIEAIDWKARHDGYRAQFEGLPVEFYTPTAEELIVLRFKHDRDSIDLVRSIFEHMTEMFPNNHVAVLPDNMSLQRMSVEELVQVRNIIDTVLELGAN